MTTTATPATDTVVGVTIDAAKHPRIATIVATCGKTYRYEKHMENRGKTAIMLGCICPDGHGVSRAPWRGWVTTEEARMTLTEIPTPPSPFALPIDPQAVAALAADADLHDEDAPIVPLDRVGVTVPAVREPVAA